tara:strand:+ start:8136 stop:8345 length:210 start_codon:yes stop_codon:yes gene_type:complete
MVTPQEAVRGNTPPTEENEEAGLLYRFLTRVIAWFLFIGFLALIAATIVFIALALWRGIIWLWPAGGVA